MTAIRKAMKKLAKQYDVDKKNTLTEMLENICNYENSLYFLLKNVERDTKDWNMIQKELSFVQGQQDALTCVIIKVLDETETK